MALEDGPVERHVWKEELQAHAVQAAEAAAGGEPRLFGYAIASDLARHYSFTHYLLLSLTGELADDQTVKAFETALLFSAHLSVADAPIHAAVLARLCGSRTGGVLAVGANALAEHADVVLGEKGLARSDAERQRVEELRTALPFAVEWPVGSSLDGAVVSVFRKCGLTTTTAITMALTFARLPLACAEALHVEPADFRSYPIDTPHFEYVPPGGGERS